MKTNALLGIIALGGTALIAATSGDNNLRIYAKVTIFSSLAIMALNQFSKFVQLCMDRGRLALEEEELDKDITTKIEILKERFGRLQAERQRTGELLQQAVAEAAEVRGLMDRITTTVSTQK